MLKMMLNRAYNNLIKPGNKIITITSLCAHIEVFVTLNAQIIYPRWLTDRMTWKKDLV